jgi:hypothetical protein
MSSKLPLLLEDTSVGRCLPSGLAPPAVRALLRLPRSLLLSPPECPAACSLPGTQARERLLRFLRNCWTVERAQRRRLVLVPHINAVYTFAIKPLFHTTFSHTHNRHSPARCPARIIHVFREDECEE